ncbi:hypothetical protein ERD78_19470 [Allopusillimonas soli]|uniref:Uncharacterized protein n=1 Tax=Allopusillimonas soli TaxID=659016 RepID=A0A853FG55_9BURK|nr:hypothetical protein [Allopusillimonas soli]NYT39063.1 hypothetical protein [Allopusillimonas soli]TEA69469.1 hypothetical protein ERD78_19470 [Allopusillimonas soli]
MSKKPKYQFKIEERSEGWFVFYYIDNWLIPGADGPFENPETAQITGELWYEAETGRAYPRKREKSEPDNRQASFDFGTDDDKR